MGCGIYTITNTIDNKVYVGSSINIKKRLANHISALRHSRHSNDYLQHSFDKYGESNFTFKIESLCDENVLFIAENECIYRLSSNKREFGFNLATVNEFRRNNFNEEVKDKIAKTNLKKNGNFIKFKCINIDTKKESIFETLKDAADYIINNDFSNGTHKTAKKNISQCLRGKIVNVKSYNGAIRRTAYKHNWEIIK